EPFPVLRQGGGATVSRPGDGPAQPKRRRAVRPGADGALPSPSGRGRGAPASQGAPGRLRPPGPALQQLSGRAGPGRKPPPTRRPMPPTLPPGRASPEGTRRYGAGFPAHAPHGHTSFGDTGLRASRIGFGCYRVDDETPEHEAALAEALSS